MFYFTNLAFMGLPGGTEFIVIALIALLLFGSRLPKVAKGLGRSIVEFKKGIKGVGDEIEDASDESAPSSQPPAGKSEVSDDEGATWRHHHHAWLLHLWHHHGRHHHRRHA